MADQIPYKVIAMCIALWNWTNEEWDAPVTVPFAEGFDPNPQYDTNMIKNNGANARGLSVLAGWQPKIKKAGINQSVLSVLHGITRSGSGTPSIPYEYAIPHGENAHYWGTILSLQMDLGAVMHWGFPLNQARTFYHGAVETNALSVKEFEWDTYIVTLSDATLQKPKWKEYSAAQALPATKNDFNSFFGIIVA